MCEQPLNKRASLSLVTGTSNPLALFRPLCFELYLKEIL